MEHKAAVEAYENASGEYQLLNRDFNRAKRELDLKQARGEQVTDEDQELLDRKELALMRAKRELDELYAAQVATSPDTSTEKIVDAETGKREALKETKDTLRDENGEVQL